MNELISYAQNREDIILNAFFEESYKGFYVDVGANHPVHESVTQLFYLRDWKGINIEPTEWLFNLLCINRPRDINLQVGVSNKEGLIKFREYLEGDGLSTFSSSMQTTYEKNGYYFAQKYREYKVPTKTLAQIFDEQNVKEIDFMKVDVEGYEYEALEGNNWKKYRPKVLCIESNHIVKDWHKMILDANYKLAFFDGLNEYFVAAEAPKYIQNFSYPDRILLGRRYITWEEYNSKKDLLMQQRLLAYKLDKAVASLNDLQANQQPNLVISHRNLRRVNNKIENYLSKPKQNREIPEEVLNIKSTQQLINTLKQQLSQTKPRIVLSKRIAHTSYNLAKSGAKKARRLSNNHG